MIDELREIRDQIKCWLTITWVDIRFHIDKWFGLEKVNSKSAFKKGGK